MKTKLLILLTAIFLTQIFLVSALSIDSAISNPQEVQPGEIFSLNLDIENNLNQTAENVVVSLDLSKVPFAPYQSSSEVRIDHIHEEDNKEANFDLSAFSDAISGTYTIPVMVSYTGSNGTESLGLVSVIINAKPKIEISSEEAFLIKGTNEKLTIKIVNSGLGDSKFLSVSMNPNKELQITSSNNIYIGNIDSNDFDTAEFNVFINANADSSVNIPVKLTYTDSRNNEITEEKTIILKAYSEKEALALGLVQKNNTTLIIISIVSAIILFLVYRKIRKNIKNKKGSQ